MTLVVRPARLSDLPYIDDLQWKNAKMLAFLPKRVFEEDISQIILAELNGQPAGYVYRGIFGPVLKIHQACIQYDLRSQLYGAAMMRSFLEEAELNGAMSVTLRCASEIDANNFWQAMGFYCEGQRLGGLARGRILNCWRLDIAPQMFASVVSPVKNVFDRTGYLRAKPGEKLASKFARGASSANLRRYRMLMEGLEP